jgi:hypothetical protein
VMKNHPRIRQVTRHFAAKSLAYFALALTVLSGFAIIWSLNRGFDLSDEAWAYSLIKSGRNTINEPWGFHWLLNPVYVMFGESVLAFRYLRTFLYFSMGVLTFVLLKQKLPLHFQNNLFFITLFSGTQIGTIVAFSYAPPYLSYNELSGFFVQLISLLLLKIAFNPEKAAINWFLIGSCLCLLFVSKISSFFLVVVFLSLIIASMGRNIFTFLSRLFGGFFIVFLTLFFFGFPMKNYLQNNFVLLFDKSLQEEYAHPIGGMLKKYLIDLIYFIPRYPLVVLSLAMIFLILRIANRSNRQVMLTLVPASVLLAILASRTDMRWNNIGTFLYFCLILTAILDLRRNLNSTVKNGKRSMTIQAGFFASLTPLLASFGTSNPILGQMLFATTVLFGLLVFNLVFVLGRTSMAVTCLIILWALSHLFFALFTNAYGDQKLIKSNVAINQGDLKGLYVSSEIYRDYQFYKILEGYAKDLDLIAINNPGALFLSTNDDFANPWINYTTWPASFLSIEHSCELGKTEKLGVILDKKMADDFMFLKYFNRSINECSLDFPSDFKSVIETQEKGVLNSKQLWISR